jgi:hypothetical protein
VQKVRQTAAKVRLCGSMRSVMTSPQKNRRQASALAR